MNALRLVRRSLWSGPRRSLAEVVRNQRVAYDRAALIARAFYAFALYWVIIDMNGFLQLQRAEAIDPQWPAGWVESVGMDLGVNLIIIGHIAAALLALCLPQWRVARFAYFFTLLQYMAILNGFGKINHNMHAWLFVSAILVLLPDRGWNRRQRIGDRHYFLTVFWCAQLAVLFFYTLTGVWKVLHGIAALRDPNLISGFQFSGFALIVGDRILLTGQETLLGEWFVRNRIPGWLLYQGTVYLEAASILIAFRPRLHRVWGIGLLLFHLGTQLGMGFTFDRNLVVLALLFVCSPAMPDGVRFRDAVLDLPGVHLAAGLVRRARDRSRPDLSSSSHGARAPSDDKELARP